MDTNMDDLDFEAITIGADTNMDDFDDFIRQQDAKNTIKGNIFSSRVLINYLKTINETRKLEVIPPFELDMLLCKFFMNVNQKNGKPYQPAVLSTIHRGINRFLQTKNYKVNVLKDKIFEKSRRVLAARRRKLKRDGFGGRPNATRELSLVEIDRLWTEGYFGTTTGVQVQRALWWALSIHCGWRGCDEARQLLWGDIILQRNESNVEYLIWDIERSSKTRIGREGEEGRKYNPTIYPSGDERCPMNLFKLFREHRPEEAMLKGFPFFLGIAWKNNGKIWYTNRPMGKNKISEMLPEARKLLKLPGKVANHSVRKTGISQLLDADIPEIFVAQHSGMKNTDSLKAYKSASEKHQVRMSNVLNDITNKKEETKVRISGTGSGNNSSGLFAGATFSNCTVYTGDVYHYGATRKNFRLLSERDWNLLNN